MKVVLLCGGRGILLDGQESPVPKALIPVEGSPILYTIMKHFSFYGITEFILCVDSKGKMIQEYLKDVTRPEKERNNISKWDITVLDTVDDARTGARLFGAKGLVGDSDFIVSYSDVIADVNVSQLLQFHKAQGLNLTMTGVHPTTPLGIITHKDGKVLDFNVEARSESTIKGGYFVCRPGVFDYLSESPDCAFEGEPLKNMINDGQVALFDHTGFWKHFESSKDLDELRRLTKDDNPSWKIQ
ncbi:sugar phosphate nucleotidyltransferase [Nanoarchaeota archaeon]